VIGNKKAAVKAFRAKYAGTTFANVPGGRYATWKDWLNEQERTGNIETGKAALWGTVDPWARPSNTDRRATA
jgi:hypothetical protein